MAKVYIKIDAENRVAAINSSDFLTDPTGWVQIDEGVGDRYTHAQGNYLFMPLTDENGVYRYKYIDGTISERTAEEMAADIIPTESTCPTTEERLDALEAAMLEMIIGGVEND